MKSNRAQICLTNFADDTKRSKIKMLLDIALKNALTGFMCLFLSHTIQAQSATRFNVYAQAVDSLIQPLPYATVILLNSSDSSLVDYGLTNQQGEFSFKNLKSRKYLLKITFVGYIPYNQLIEFSTQTTLELGRLKLLPITRELTEVTVKTSKVPLTIKGDTIEYNGTAFKVPPGSSVEDLLRKLPGVQIDQEGNILAQGQVIKKVTVNGKQFFGNDPKLATKNLPADAIAKVQVFNDKSEQARLTGVNDGKKEATINLALKDEFKKAGFGKAALAAGPATQNIPTRIEGRGNYYKFDNKRQFSAILLGNNTNQSGLSYNDYQDFRASSTFNLNDNADFGFSSENHNTLVSNENESLIIPISGSDNRGFSKNIAGGVNYNYDTKKTVLSTSYYFNQTRQNLDALRDSKRFLTAATLHTTEIGNQDNLLANHRISLRIEKKIDSLQTLVVISNSRFSIANSDLLSKQYINQSVITATELPYAYSILRNNGHTNQSAMANTLLYRLKFKKEDRNFGVSITYQFNKNDGALLLQAHNDFYQITSVDDRLRALNQDQNSNLSSNQYKGNLFYVEPFAKKFFWETFYNFSRRYDEVNRIVLNINDSRQRIDSLSLYYKNFYTYNRLGSSLRFSHKGLNASVGLAGQVFVLDGEFARDQSEVMQPLRRTYRTLIPNVGLNFDLKNDKFLYGSYNIGIQIPSAHDLQPVATNTNPLFISKGNPDLLPQLMHQYTLGFRYFNSGSFLNFWSSLYRANYVNQIIYSQSIDRQTLIQTTLPENISGGYTNSMFFGSSLPLKKTKVNLRLNGTLSSGRNLTRIRELNGDQLISNNLNQTQNQTYSWGGGVDLTLKEWITLYSFANWNRAHTTYSINTSQNQVINNNNYRVDVNVKFPGGIYMNSTLNYKTFANVKMGFHQQIPILNTALYYILGKDKKSEIRLSIYDLFNRNIYVSQYAGQNYTQTESVQTLARYFLLSFTYNMWGITAKMRRQDFY